ncbi:hypothetical protein NHQ30_008641 [Ciborinia camelliae]|nr:hypothetical protein NHQ30_008641 [Ciborinia camelliae]
MHQVIMVKEPICNCRDWGRGHLCKHIVFVLGKVLELEAPLRHQVAFLSTEVDNMLDIVVIDDYCQRKRVDMCYICLDELDANDNTLTWCKSQCGVSFHRHCMLHWAAENWKVKRDATCRHCRALWDVYRRGIVKSD